MKVREVIAALQKQDQEAELKVSVSQRNKRYPVAEAPVIMCYGTTISIHLPEGQSVSTRKNKQLKTN